MLLDSSRLPSCRSTASRRFSTAGIGCLIVAILIGTGTLSSVSAQNPLQRKKDLRSFEDQYRKLRSRLTQEIHKLLEERESAGDNTAVEELRLFEKPIDRERLRGLALPETVREELPADLSSGERAWRTRLQTLRSEHATDLFQLARQSGQKQLVVFAFDMLREALFHDPDHTGARRTFGYRRIDNLWLTSFAAEMRRKKHVWNDSFGWLPAEHVARYENGERNFKGQWVSAEKERELRTSFQNAWVVRTEHFEVRTNQSLEGGVILARELEAFYSVFYATFAASFTPPEQLRQLLDGSTAPTVHKPHRVHYYRTRAEYLKTCQPKMPVNIGITLGLYIPGDQVSYFYHPEDPQTDVRRTLFHEATHQLFSESRRSRYPIAVNANFWIVEGIACYMESYKPLPDGYSLGDPTYVRFQNARDRRLGRPDLPPYYRPLAEFVAMGQLAYQRDPQQRANYSQGSGLTHFFMHFREGLYRDALIEHLSEIYSLVPRKRANPDSLEVLTEVSFAELDRQYADYIKQQAESLRNAPRPPPLADEIEDVFGADAAQPPPDVPETDSTSEDQ